MRIFVLSFFFFFFFFFWLSPSFIYALQNVAVSDYIVYTDIVCDEFQVKYESEKKNISRVETAPECLFYIFVAATANEQWTLNKNTPITQNINVSAIARRRDIDVRDKFLSPSSIVLCLTHLPSSQTH